MCSAIMRSSSVGITHTDTRDRDVEMRGPPARLAASSSSTPSHSARAQTRARISGEFSPMPAVSTSASIPPMAAAREPISRAIR